MMHLSRFCEEIIVWNSNEYQFVDIDDSYSTGSSIMPQKKNPDIAELIRGKTGRVDCIKGELFVFLHVLIVGKRDALHRRKHADESPIDTMKFKKENMEASAKNGFTNATDAADYLVNHGVPFRDAHGIIGQLVLLCIDKNISLDDLPLEEYKKISPVFFIDR